MNKIFNLVWSSATQRWCCVSEAVKSRGKPSRSGQRATLTVATLLPLQLLAAPPPPAANQLPTGGQVVAGQATVSANNALSPLTPTLTIRQGSERAAINWQSFSIGSAAKVEFQQPSANSVALNRVIGADPSQIFGKLSANGSVYLTNPNGVLFAPGAQVDVGGLVATTMGITNADFMAGKAAFTRNGSTASVINQAELTAGNFVALLAPEVRNEGVIVAQATVLAAGEAITLSFGADSKLADISVTPAQIRTLVENRQAILAEGGQIILASRAADKLAGSVVNSGTLSASSISERGGVIRIEADSITLTESSKISADGTSGGTIQVGSMATHDTRAAGTLSARGSAGAGGLVETSAQHLSLGSDLRVDTRGSVSTGNWLLDPYDLTVGSSDAATISTNLGTSNVTLQTSASGTSGPGTANSAGSGDITINSAITWSSANTLTLDAYRNISINAAVTASNAAGKVVMITGDTGANQTSTGGDYSFNLGNSGFAGSLNFTGVANGNATSLSINGSAYTLLTDMSASGFQVLAGKGAATRYALAKNITSAGTFTSVGPGGTFAGTFTGLGHTIDGLTVSVASGSNVGTGAFGTLTGTARDIGITNGTISPGAATVVGAGLLAGKSSSATVKNVYTTGAVTASTTSHSSLGGLIGQMTGGSVDNSWSSATISAKASNDGGLIGSIVTTTVVGATVSNSHATGSVTETGSGGFNIGGLIGGINPAGNSNYLGTTVSNSYATGNISNDRENAGGLIGLIQGGTTASHNVVSNSYATGTITNAAAATGAGGLVGTGSAGYTDFSDVYATGSLSVANGSAGVGGLIGSTATGTFTVTRAYATGNVAGTVYSTSMGGLIGDAANTTMSTVFATGNVSGCCYLGGLVGATRANSSITDAYALGGVSWNGYSAFTDAGGLVGYIAGAIPITNAYYGGTIATNTGNRVVPLYPNAGSVTASNVYWDSTKNGSTGWTGSPTVTGGGAKTTAQLQDGSYPNGYSPSIWSVLPGEYPYFKNVGTAPASAANFQVVSGTAYTTGGSTGVNTGEVKLYLAGSLLSTTSTNASGAYSFAVPAGSFTATTPLGETLALSSGGAIVGASYNDTRTLSGSNGSTFAGFNITQNVFDWYSSAGTLSAMVAASATPFGSSLDSTLKTTLNNADHSYRSSGDLTVDAAPNVNGAVTLAATGGDLTVDTAFSTTAGKALTLMASDTAYINVPITATNTTAATLTAPDWHFNLVSDTGFTGSLTFGSTVSTASLKINGNPYTLLYDFTSGANGFKSLQGKTSGYYALAQSLNNVGTSTTSPVTTFGDTTNHSVVLTGLGHVIDGMTINTTVVGRGLFTNLYGTVRDLGVTNATISSTSMNVGNFGVLAANANYTTIQDVYTTGTLSNTNTGSGASGGLIGIIVNTTIDNSFSTVNLNLTGNSVGGLIGTLDQSGTAATSTPNSVITNSHATGNVFGATTIGGLVGGINSGSSGAVTGSVFDNVYATGNVTSNTSGAVGGLIGGISSGTPAQPTIITNAHATGAVSGTGTGGVWMGGLIGNAGAAIRIADSYASGDVTTAGTIVGGFIGRIGGSSITIDRSYAAGDVTSTATTSSTAGGFIGILVQPATINESFASGDVTGSQYVGGFIAQINGNNGTVLNDVYALGDVIKSSNAVSPTAFGGLLGYVTNTTTITNAYATGSLPTGTTNTGAIAGVANGIRATNVYYDSTTQGSTPYGTTSNLIVTGGGALTDAQLTSGALPTGFNTGNTVNGTPWNTSAGFYPYFDWQNLGNQAINGTAYTALGAAAGSATVKLYTNGVLLSGGQVITDTTTGTYRALVPVGSVVSTTKLGGTLTLSGGSSIAGASYTDAPTMSGADVIGFDLKAGLFLASTSQTTQTALNTSLGTAFGSSLLATINSDTLAGARQINASGAFTLDTALTQTGNVGLSAGGALTISAALTSSSGTAILQSSGALTDGSGGSITATSLSLQGGSVTLDNTANSVTTLAGSGLTSLAYTSNGALTIGSIASLNSGITATSINGTTATLNGIAGTGTLAVSTTSGNLTLNQAVSTTDTTSSAITLTAGASGSAPVAVGSDTAGNIVVGGSGALSTGSGGRATLYSGSIADSTGLAALAGAGNSRYGSSATVTNFSSALGSGSYAVYRERPTAVVTAGNAAITYADSLPTFTSTITGAVNGDSGLVGGLGYTLGGSTSTSGNATAGSHAITPGGTSALGYSISFVAGTLSVATKSISASGVTAGNKVYDGTTTATLNTAGLAFTGAAGGDALGLAGTSGSFGDKNVGTAKAVTVSGTLSGADAGNYTLSGIAGTSANITPKGLTISGVSAANKVYDGNTTATIDTSGISYAGRVGSDDVSLTGVSGSFADKNVGTAKAVTLGGTVTGNDAGNYTITPPSGLTANITAKTLTVSDLAVADRAYNGSAVASVITGSVQFTGLVAGDNVSLTSSNGAFADRHVGTAKAVALTNVYGGSDLGNYAVVDQTATTASITAAPLVLSVSNVSKTYDGTTTVTSPTLVAVSGTQLFGSDSASGATVAFANKNAGAGNKVVNVSGATVNDGNGGADYTLSYLANTTSTITPKALTVSGILAQGKTYDGTTAATIDSSGAIYTGLVSGDVLAVSATGVFSDKNAGTNKTVTLTSSYSGADVGNYTITGQASALASIAQRTLTVTPNDDVKFVTTSDTAGYAGVHYDGFVGGDTVAVVNTAGMSVSRPGQGSIESPGTYAGALHVSGGSSSNYALTYGTGSFRIAPVESVIVKVTNTSTSYGSGTASYAVTSVEYMDSGAFISSPLLIGHSGNNYVFDDNYGGIVQFTLSPTGAVTSTAGQLRAGNYGIGGTVANTANPNVSGGIYFVGNHEVLQKSLSPSASGVSKVYDGTTAMTGVTVGLTGKVGADVVTVSGSGAFSQKNVGTGLNYTVSGLALGSSDAGNYYLSGGSSLSGNDGAITPATITISGITAQNKVYDRTTAAVVDVSGAVLGGRISGDDVGVSATGVFADKSAATGKTVTLTSSHSGADAGNYVFSDQATTTATITPKALYIGGLEILNRAYDGTTAIAVGSSTASFTGLISGDTVTISSSGSFADKHVGGGKAVTISSTYGGADAGNYDITSQASGSADITKATLVLSTGNVSKTYDGGTTVTGASASVVGGTLFSGDTLSGGSFAFTNKNVGAGTKTVTVGGVTVSDGNSGGNYDLSYVNNTTSTISPKALSISGITAADKVYDRTTAATVSTTGAVYTGLVSGDQLSVSASGSFADKNVGVGKTVTLTSSYSGSDAGNYTITDQATTTATITPKALTVSGISAADKPYDRSTAATVSTAGAVYTGLIAGDQFSVGATGSFSDAHAGVGKTVTLVSTHGGADAGNYTVTDQATTTATITPLTVTVTGLPDTNGLSKVYDATTGVAIDTSGVSVSGLLGGDSVGVSASGTTADKNVGTNKPVTITAGFTGANAGDYVFAFPTSGLVTITPKALTISGITAANRPYDRTTAATVSTTGAVFSGLVSGDQFSVSATGSFADAHAGVGKTVTLVSTHGGADAGNYTVTDQATTTATITPLTVTVSGLPDSNGLSKVYDGTTGVAIDTSGVSITGVLGGDSVGVSASGTTADKNVGVDKPVAITAGFTGANAGDYVYAFPSSGLVTVTPKALTLSGITAADKTYDATTAATLGFGGAVFAGVVSGDTVGYATSGAFVDKNAGVGKTVNLTSSLSGADAGNYALNAQATTTATITPRAIAVSGLPDTNGLTKTYDGTTGVAIDTSGTTITGVLPGDSVGIAASGTTTDKNAGVDKPVSVSAGLTGSDAGNYIVPGLPTSGLVTISPKALLISGITAANRAYDRTTLATVSTTGAVFSGLVSGDQFSVSATGSFSDAHAGVGKTVTLVSTHGGADAGNYVVTDQTTTTATITPLTVTVSGLPDTNGLTKTYDGTSAVTIDTSGVSVGGLLAGDSLGVQASGATADKNVGVDKPVTITAGFTGANAGDYVFAFPTTGLVTIAPKALLISGITAANKAYDRTTTASVSTAGAVFDGLVSGDQFSVSATGTFSDAHAGVGKTVTLVSTHGGADAGNYIVTDQATTTATITPLTVTVSGLPDTNGLTKTYDGTTAVAIDTSGVSVGGLLAGDTVGVQASGTTADKNAGVNKPVTITAGFTGDNAGDYVFNFPTTGSVTIAAKLLTISGIIAADRPYDRTTLASVSTAGAVFDGLVSGDQFSVSATGSFADAHAGVGKTVTLTSTHGGADASNYIVTDQATTTATITPLTVTVSGLPDTNGLTKTYDGTTAVTIDTSGVSVGGLLPGDSVGVSASGTTADKNAGTNKPVTISAGFTGDNAGDYVFDFPTTGSVTIAPRALIVSGITAADRAYDRTNVAGVSTALAVYDGLVAGDQFSISATGLFADSHAGINKTVTLTSTHLGADAGNYIVTDQATTTATITPLTVTVSGLPDTNGLTKTYDGTTGVAIDTSGVSVGGLLPGDSVGVQASGSTADKNVGVNKPVTITAGFTGDNAGDYVFNFPTTGTVTIAPRPVTIGGATAVDKVFDGTNVVQINGAHLNTEDLVPGDLLTLTHGNSGSVADPQPGNAKPVTTTMGLAGDDAGNYTVIQPGGLTVTITPATTPVVEPPPVLPPAPAPAPTAPSTGSGDNGNAGQPALPTEPPPPPVTAPPPPPPAPAPSSGGSGPSGGPVVDPGAGSGVRPGDDSPPVSSLRILATPAEATAQGGAFVSVLSFEPAVVRSGASITMALPLNTFTHSDPVAVLSIDALQANGQPLPSWLTFDATTMRFTGTPPAGVQSVEVEVVARDQNGHEARTRVTIRVDG